MARKTITITLRDREQDLTFEIAEMSASKTHDWLVRALLLVVGGGGTELPPGLNLKSMSQSQAIGVAVKSMLALDYDKVKPLLDELLTCCTRVCDDGVRQAVTVETLDGYLEDFTTLFKLRKAVLELHFGFFINELGPMLAPLKARVKTLLEP